MNKKYKPIYIALGANLSNPKETFANVLKDMPELGIEVLAVSGLWQSPSWPPGQGHPDYVNAVAEVDFKGSALELLKRLHTLEKKNGRVRSERNAPRPLDLDILDFRGKRIDTPDITIPHPRMLTRSFVLFPLHEITPDWRDPVSKTFLMAHIARLPLRDVQPLEYIGALG